ncbi:zinc-finger of the MIZ type in Nse subunit-domain-containing protein [Choanephora cucurbitarum]|nr:zinc-finger of the MIZ type in Nse subunit-domain-containing protein [Choanephora cucurbitarum]
MSNRETTLEDIRDNFSFDSRNSNIFSNVTGDIRDLQLLIQKGQGHIKTAAEEHEEAKRAEKVAALDERFKRLIDLSNQLHCHKNTMDQLKTRIDRGEKVKDIAGHYEKEKDVQSNKIAADESKKFYRNNSYLAFRQLLWTIHHPDEEMPSLVETTEEDDIVMGPSKISLKCPLTTTWFEDPMTSIICKHTFSKSAIFSLFRHQNAIPCPIPGCNRPVQRASLKPDDLMAERVKRAKEREKEGQKATQFFDVE